MIVKKNIRIKNIYFFNKMLAFVVFFYIISAYWVPFYVFDRALCQNTKKIKTLARKNLIFFVVPSSTSIPPFLPSVLSSQFPGTYMFSQLGQAAGGRAAAAAVRLLAAKMELSRLPGWIRNWILLLFCYPSGADPVGRRGGVGVCGDGVVGFGDIQVVQQG